MLTANQISAACHWAGLPRAVFSNTGGGVYNLELPIADSDGNVFAYVAFSDSGDWGYTDYQTPAEFVTVVLYDALTGDPYSARVWAGQDFTDADGTAAYADYPAEAVRLARMAIDYVTREG